MYSRTRFVGATAGGNDNRESLRFMLSSRLKRLFSDELRKFIKTSCSRLVRKRLRLCPTRKRRVLPYSALTLPRMPFSSAEGIDECTTSAATPA